MKINVHTFELDSKIEFESYYRQGDIFQDTDSKEFYMICWVSYDGYNLISLQDGECWSGKLFPTLKKMTEEIISQKCFSKVDSGSILKITVS